MNTQVSQEQLALQKLRRFIEAGGPEESEYNELTSIWNSPKLEDKVNLVFDHAA